MIQGSKFLLLTLCLSLQAEAKMADAEQPLHIQAGSVEIREQEGISIYKDKVRISRGSMVIEGELIHIHAEKNRVKNIRVEGKPARFKQLNEQDEEVSAESQEMEYKASENKLILKKQAVLVQGKNKFTSDHIVYDTRQDIVQAGDPTQSSDSAASERVTITILPEEEEEKKDTEQP